MPAQPPENQPPGNQPHVNPPPHRQSAPGAEPVNAQDHLVVVAVAGGPLATGESPRQVSADSPFLLADDLGAVRGDGVFDALLIHRGEPLKMPRHLDRIQRSADMIDLSAPVREAWQAGIEVAVAAWQRETGGIDAMLRLALTGGPEHAHRHRPTAYITVAPISSRVRHVREHGLRVQTLARGLPTDLTEQAPWLLVGAKTVSYAINMAATRHAQAAGFDDALFLAHDGEVLEGPRSTLVLVRDGALVTPPPQVGILAGTTVDALFELAQERGIETRRERLTVPDILTAEAAWFISSVTLAARITQLDQNELSSADILPDVAALVAEAVGWRSPSTGR